MERPDLTTLTEQQKDQLIQQLFDYIERLEPRIKEFEERLSKNSSNSSKPPSSDGFNKPDPKSRRSKNKKKKNALSDAKRLHYEGRQVYDLPSLDFKVTEHRAYKKSCARCGVITKADFPPGVAYSVQYGSKAKGLMVYMHHYQLLPFDRNREFFADVFNQSISVATIASASEISDINLEESENHTKQQLINSKLLQADETGFRVNGGLFWLHVASTNRLTFYAAHKKRGSVAMNEIDLLTQFNGTLVHDHLKSYFQYAKGHSLCNAHHLRELTFVQEHYKHKWAEKIEKLLLNIKHSVESHYAKVGSALPVETLKRYRNRYMNILREANAECPRDYGNGTKKKAGVKQTKEGQVILFSA